MQFLEDCTEGRLARKLLLYTVFIPTLLHGSHKH